MKTRTQIFKMASRKMRVGARKHGAWNPKKDKRNLKAEAVDELLDCINYCVMAMQKLSLRQ